MRLYPLTLALSPLFLDQLEPIERSNGRKCGRGHHLVESGYMRKSQNSPFLKPRPTEARTFIFLYEITPTLLKWPTENSKRAAPRR